MGEDLFTPEELLVSISESSYRWGDRVQRVKSWGEAQREAGRASQREELAVRCAECHEPLGEDYRTHECVFAATATAPEPGGSTRIVNEHEDSTFAWKEVHNPELAAAMQPASLVERTKRQLSEPTLLVSDASAVAVIGLAEAIDALTAEQATAADVRRQLRDMQKEILARLEPLEELARQTSTYFHERGVGG